ncbi:MAG: AraC family transcriptional regulator [Myxococcales bacterium]|nr:AraC family transcriptional regulator [Myxococcales bacterium]
MIEGIVTTDCDSELGCWTSSLWQPPHLARFVERFWYSAGTTSVSRERLLPNGLVELAICLAEPHRLIEGAGTQTLRLCLTGLQTGPMVIEHPSYHRVLGLRLHPAGAYALLSLPMGEVSGLTVDLGDLLGATANELAERCNETVSVEGCFQIAANWVAERVLRARALDPRIAWSVGRIEQSTGKVPIAELREATGLSKTRLANVFRDQIGVLPKVNSRIVRYRRALALLDRATPSLADVAVESGYYDQSHMTTEFRELGRLTPREFVATHYPGSTTALEY